MDSSNIHSPRLYHMRELIHDRDLDSVLVTDISNVFYLSGFTGSTAALVVTMDAAHILVDPRYSIQARQECACAVVHGFTGMSLLDAVADLIKEIGSKYVGYEADHVTVSSYRRLAGRLRGSTSLRSTSGLVRQLRQIKDPHEIALIRQASQITDSSLALVVESIKPGITEKQLALLIDSTMRSHGADREGFETIAASGPNSACPHAHPTDRAIRKGDFVKMDFGARYALYNSDITRTVCVGKPSAKQREVYQIVLDAQRKAIEAVAPGADCRHIDHIAREHIRAAGYGDHFGHGLGHSFGIEVHEEPRFSPTAQSILAPGMVMTVEPGIYIEDWGGVRIEDDVLVTETGCEILTHFPKELHQG